MRFAVEVIATDQRFDELCRGIRRCLVEARSAFIPNGDPSLFNTLCKETTKVVTDRLLKVEQ